MHQISMFDGDASGPLTEADIRDLLVDIEPYLWAAIVNPFDDVLERRQEDPAFRLMDEGETAQWLRPQIVQHAKRIFEHQDAMQFKETRQQKLFEYKDAVTICFKKITERQLRNGKRRLERSNYATKQNLDLWQQRKVEGFSDLPRLIIGYELLREMTDVRVLIAYPRARHRGFQWVYEMDNQDAQLLRIVEDAAPKRSIHEGDAESPGFIVRPRRSAWEKRVDG